MAKRECPGCRRLQQRVAELEALVAQLQALVRELQAQLDRNASNSSLPPSANPPSAPKPVTKEPTGRKPGGQPGHQAHLRTLLPKERVQRVIHHVPHTCRRCQAALPQEAHVHDPAPRRHQIAELPELRAEVTEHQAHARTCPHCGTLTQAVLPAEVRGHSLGPKLTATLAYLSGRCHLSKRAVEEVTETLFEVPVALGTVSNLEQEMSEALAPAHAEVAAAVQQAPSKNVDETSWKQAGKLCWLWTAATTQAVLFVVHARRSAQALQALLGQAVHGVLGCDRYSAYHRVPLSQRQVCWAHLRRDFQAMAERGGVAGDVGETLLTCTRVLFIYWYKVRDGTRQRPWFGRMVADIRQDVVLALQRGCSCRCAKTAATCREILAVESALWTFAYQEGIEPTNNRAERALRPAVLWRKRSQGCWSAAGCRYVERMLTVVHTLRLQEQPVLAYLQAALTAHRARLPAPQLLPGG